MKSITEYCAEKGMSRRNVQRWIGKGKVKSCKIGGKVYIIEQEDTSQPITDRTEGVKERWDTMIKRAIRLHKEDASNPEIRMLTDRIVRENEALKMRGYDYKSLRRKITTGVVERKPRADRFTIKHRILRKQISRVIDELEPLYFKPAKRNLNYAIDRLLMKAAETEEMWEIAAIPKSTLYTAMNRYATANGFKDVEELMNHHNAFEYNRVTCHGAFTEDIKFMQVWALDDHKTDVAGAWVWNEKIKKYELKQVTSWVLIDAHTMYPLAWKFKCGSFSSDEIVDLIAQALLKYGRPSEKIICDQGLGAERRVKQFCYKAGVLLDDQLAYQPRHKATMERFFGWVKEESDVLQNNFVGSNHPVEGKHSGPQLSPEATEELVSEAIIRYDDYFMNMLVNRPRKMKRAGAEHLLDATGRIQLSTLFATFRREYVPDYITAKELRAAYMKVDNPRRFYNELKFANDHYMPLDVQSPALNGRKFYVGYLPFDLQTIDLYASESFVDAVFGVEYSAGDFVCTLASQRAMNSEERKVRVAKYNKEYRKLVRSLMPAIPEEVRPDGTVSSTRKSAERALISTLKNAVTPEVIEKTMEAARTEVEAIGEKAVEKYFEENIIKKDELDWSSVEEAGE